MRSASSFARFSASSKSIKSPVIFFAPSFCVFLAPRTEAFRGPAPVMALLRMAAEDVVRVAAGGAEVDAAAPTSGDCVRVIPLPLLLAVPLFRKGEGVRPTTGGVLVREIGGVGRLMAGLSQDEKKSSSGSPAGVEVPSVAPVELSATTTSPGELEPDQHVKESLTGV